MKNNIMQTSKEGSHRGKLDKHNMTSPDINQD